MRSSRKPDDYTSVSPYLVVDGASGTIDFLVKVFGAVELRRFPGANGKLLHAEVRIDDTVLMLADGGEGFPPVPSHVHIYVRDVDATYKRALEGGAKSVQEPVKKQDPDRRGGVKDAGGTTWWIATQVEQATTRSFASRDKSLQLFLKNVLFTVLVPGTVAVFVPLYVFGHAKPGVSPASLAAALLVLIGGSIYTWCIWDFAVTGRGTPAPIEPPKSLVVRGLYKYSRNPMYVGVLCVIGGWSLLFRSVGILVYGICLATAFHLFVRLYEEPHLGRTFGSSYELYCSQVGRWLTLPGRRKSTDS